MIQIFLTWFTAIDFTNMFGRFKSEGRRIVCSHCDKAFADCEDGIELKTPVMRFESTHMSYSYDQVSGDEYNGQINIIVQPDDSKSDEHINFKKSIEELDSSLVDFMCTHAGQRLIQHSVYRDDPQILCTNFGPYYEDNFDYEDEPIVVDNAFHVAIPFLNSLGKENKIRYFYSDGSERNKPFPKGTLCRLHLKYNGPKYIKWISFGNSWRILGVYAE